MSNPNFFATTVTATTAFQNLGTLLGAAGLDTTSGAVTSVNGYIRNTSSSVNLYIGTGTSAPTTQYITVLPLAALALAQGANVNQIWVASASSTVALDFAEGAIPAQIPVTVSNGTITLTNNVIPKGSSNNLVNSSITDNGTVITTTEGFLSSSTAGIGYTTGAGVNPVQTSSRTTAVTANAPCGTITLFHAAGSATAFSFTVNNSIVTARDVVVVHQRTGADLYQIFVTALAAGSFRLTVIDISGTTTEQPEISFAVIKGVNA